MRTMAVHAHRYSTTGPPRARLRRARLTPRAVEERVVVHRSAQSSPASPTPREVLEDTANSKGRSSCGCTSRARPTTCATRVSTSARKRASCTDGGRLTPMATSGVCSTPSTRRVRQAHGHHPDQRSWRGLGRRTILDPTPRALGDAGARPYRESTYRAPTPSGGGAARAIDLGHPPSSSSPHHAAHGRAACRTTRLGGVAGPTSTPGRRQAGGARPCSSTCPRAFTTESVAQLIHGDLKLTVSREARSTCSTSPLTV